MVHEKEDEANPGKMKRFKSRADEPREGTLRLSVGPNPRWVPRESPTDLLRKWLQDVGSPLVLRQAIRVGPHRGDWDLEFDESPECSWSVTASSTARAGAVVLGRLSDARPWRRAERQVADAIPDIHDPSSV